MFLRSVRSSNGQQEHLRLAKLFREGDNIKQHIVAHLGRGDLQAPHCTKFDCEGSSRAFLPPAQGIRLALTQERDGVLPVP